MRRLAGAAGFLAAAYGLYVASAWLRYGRPPSARPSEADALLDRFMPEYEVAERHHIEVAAPAEVTFAAACDIDLMRSRIIRAIFRMRELLLRARPGAIEHQGLLTFVQSLGWRPLAELTGRRILMGTVTQPWEPNVVFRPLSPDEFLAFNEPDYVKIAWTLRADPVGHDASVFRHETRVQTTDASARGKFRTYWAFFSPGIRLIRWLLLLPLRNDAEEQVSHGATAGPGARPT